MDLLNKRVMQFVSAIGLSKSDFASAIGVQPSLISHISSGRNKVGVEVLQKMLEIYPDISAEWLMLGKGDMFTQNNTNQSIRLKVEVQNLISEMDLVQNQFNVLKRKFDKLASELKG
ncbi:MAG: helix-turn-helix transcriptional regulator [Flavobacteriales bacterium]|nr:helix-turn-helix transcriptional regulator [Flavobacteriales bacterium]